MNSLRFIKSYVKRLAAARRDLSQGSIKNCHARGVYSILLREDPIERLFVTTPEHEMWAVDEHDVPATIAFHSHHCDLRLETIRGEFANVTWTRAGREFRFAGYMFDSKIMGGDGKFLPLGPTVYHDRAPLRQVVDAGQRVVMGASEIHSVLVPKGEVAAWLVTEADEDPNYSPIAWSTQDLTRFDAEGLYLPMTDSEALGIVESALS